MEIYSKDSMGMFNEKKHINILSDNLCRDFVIISIIILAINGISLFKYDNATDYEKSALRPGEYVKFQLKDYLSKPLDEYNSDVSSGQCEVEVTFSEITMYTIFHTWIILM